MRSYRFLAFAAFQFLLSAFALAEDFSLPRNWRDPTKMELAGNWRSRSPERFAFVNGDFNGDRIPDQVRLLISTKKIGFGIFAFISTKNGAHQFYKLEASKDMKLFGAIGIEKVFPAHYRTVCGKGYHDCKKNEPEEIVIKFESIKYFKTESTSSVFYWNERKNRFDRVWMED